MTFPVLNFALSVTLLLSTGVSAFKKGPPVDDPHHHHLCEDMSPAHGHGVPPITDRPAPFELTANSQCYRRGSKLTVKLASTDNETYFEGLFVLARKVSDNSTVNGQFDTNGDQQLQTLSCGHGSANNSIGHSIDKHYMEKVFTWTPDSSLNEPVYFIATVVHKKIKFWLGVTSPIIRYDPQCILTVAGSSSIKTAPISSLLYFIVTILATYITRRQLLVTVH